MVLKHNILCIPQGLISLPKSKITHLVPIFLDMSSIVKREEVEWVRPKLKKTIGPKDNEPIVGDRYILTMDQVEVNMNK